MSYGKPITRKMADGEEDFDGYDEIYCDKCGADNANTPPEEKNYSAYQHLCADCISEIEEKIQK